MPHPTKIATCCYCSSRTMLKPSARDGHELACGSCGAPLHEMKWLKAPAPEPARPQPKYAPRPQSFSQSPQRPKKPTKKKYRKPLWRRGLEEAWDLLEDIFD